jgi:regulator of sirC expression with transglutaminase-like and TPR domain
MSNLELHSGFFLKESRDMEDKELKALISLLDDDDQEILEHVEKKIISLGGSAIPLLESEWESNFNPKVQRKIEDLIHHLQFESLKGRLERWRLNNNEDLLEGMWLISQYQYPDLEYDKLKQEFEQIYFKVWPEFMPDANAFDQVKILNNAMFNKLKFTANKKNFHAPGNSMINIVLESKKGNPISLCVVYMLIAQKLSLPVYGVNLPNLFILTYKTKEVQFYINAFNKGLIFTKEDINNYLAHLNLAPLDLFYQPCSNVEIVSRVIRNLIVSFEKLGEQEKVKEVKMLLNILSPGVDQDNSFN